MLLVVLLPILVLSPTHPVTYVVSNNLPLPERLHTVAEALAQVTCRQAPTN